MSSDLLSVDGAAELLRLHPKTVLRFIHEGRLRATRVGKAYRILRSDVAALGGLPVATAPTARVTAIVDVAGISHGDAERVATYMLAMINGNDGEPIQLQTAHDPQARTLKVVVIASPGDSASLLSALNDLLGGMQ